MITEHGDAMRAGTSATDVRLRRIGQYLKPRLTLQQAGFSDNARTTFVVRIIGGSKSEESTHNEIPKATAPAAPEMPALVASEVFLLSPVPLAAPIIDTSFEQQIMERIMQQFEQMAKMMNGEFEQQIFKTREDLSYSKYAALDMPGRSPPPPEATPNDNPTNILPFDKKTVVSYEKLAQGELRHAWPVPRFAKSRFWDENQTLNRPKMTSF